MSGRYGFASRCLTAIVLVLATALMTFADESTQYLQFPLVDHPAYDYFSRLETSQDVPLFSGTRPYLGFVYHPRRLPEEASRSCEARRYLAEGSGNMFIVGQFRDEPRESSWNAVKDKLPFGLRRASWLYESGFHLASWEYDSTLAASIQPVYGLDVIRTDSADRTIKRFAGGLRVEGGYAQRLHFMVDFRDYTESGNGSYLGDAIGRGRLYEDRWGLVELGDSSSKPMSTSYNISESFLQYYGQNLSLAAGRGRFRWGPAQFGSLFLNSQMPPFDYVRFDAAIEAQHSDAAVYYTFLHGWLESDLPAETLYVNPGGRPRTLDAAKYLSAQRLELRPFRNLLFGLSQGIVYGDRPVQLGYVTPLNFLYSVQHSMNDKDNFVLGMDGTWRPVRGMKFYSELFFDDITVSALTTARGTNKSAYTVGTQLMLPHPFFEHFDARVEYTKIRPFVYSHIFAANVYTHWTSPIGYTRQPNSEFLTAELRAVFYPLEVAVHIVHQNHGSVGGNIYTPLYENSQTNVYKFLSGDLVRTTRAGLQASCEVLPNLFVFASGTQVKTTAKPDRVELEGGFSWNR
ncbi:MAG TPA: capsule assembly Wzi family protein [bacterium]|jgi:hypothetical protein